MFVIHKDGKPYCRSGGDKFAKVYFDKKLALQVAKSENTQQANSAARYCEDYYDLHYTERYPLELAYAEKLAKETWKSWEVIEYIANK